MAASACELVGGESRFADQGGGDRHRRAALNPGAAGILDTRPIDRRVTEPISTARTTVR
jgi:hypothetical protein